MSADMKALREARTVLLDWALRDGPHPSRVYAARDTLDAALDELEALRARDNDGLHQWAPHHREGWVTCARCGMVRNYGKTTTCRGLLPPIDARGGK